MSTSVYLSILCICYALTCHLLEETVLSAYEGSERRVTLDNMSFDNVSFDNMFAKYIIQGEYCDIFTFSEWSWIPYYRYKLILELQGLQDIMMFYASISKIKTWNLMYFSRKYIFSKILFIFTNAIVASNIYLLKVISIRDFTLVVVHYNLQQFLTAFKYFTKPLSGFKSFGSDKNIISQYIKFRVSTEFGCKREIYHVLVANKFIKRDNEQSYKGDFP